MQDKQTVSPETQAKLNALGYDYRKQEDRINAKFAREKELLEEEEDAAIEELEQNFWRTRAILSQAVTQ